MGQAAPFAGTAEVARPTTVQRLGQICHTRGHDHAPELFTHALAEEGLLAGERNRRLELTVGKKVDALRAPRNANVFFDKIVVRLDIFVSERPIFPIAVVRSRLEIPIAVAQAEAAPNVGPPAGNAHATHPKERLVGRGGVRFLEIVDEPVGVVFAASESGLDRTSLAQDFRSHVAIFQLERGLVLGEILVGLRFAGFEESYPQSGFRQPSARPSAGSAGTYNNDVVKAVLFFRHSVSLRDAC